MKRRMSETLRSSAWSPPSIGSMATFMPTSIIHPTGGRRRFVHIVAGLCFILVGSGGFHSPEVQSADRIILRNLEIISDGTVTQFHEDGIRLDNGRTLSWDEVERGTVAERQAEFDQLLAELGEPLYRIRQRLTVGDYQGILEPAESVYPRYVSRRSSTAYMVFQGLMWARLAAGQREAALEPYLLCIEFLRHRPRGAPIPLPGDRRLRWDPETGLSDELLPIWFDGAAARKALPGIGRVVGGMRKPWPPAVPLYYASLAVGAEESGRVASALRLFDSDRESLRQLASILNAQQEILADQSGPGIGQLQATLPRLEGMNRALALYWLGIWKARNAQESDVDEAILHLLRLPASHASSYPDLAAAALDAAGKTLLQADRAVEGEILLEELRRTFGTTFHARQRKIQE
jgi:hypothetical protein